MMPVSGPMSNALWGTPGGIRNPSPAWSCRVDRPLIAMSTFPATMYPTSSPGWLCQPDATLAGISVRTCTMSRPGTDDEARWISVLLIPEFRASLAGEGSLVGEFLCHAKTTGLSAKATPTSPSFTPHEPFRTPSTKDEVQPDIVSDAIWESSRRCPYLAVLAVGSPLLRQRRPGPAELLGKTLQFGQAVLHGNHGQLVVDVHLGLERKVGDGGAYTSTRPHSGCRVMA